MFAVEPNAVQLAWRGLGAGSRRVRIGAREVTIDAPAGAVVVDGLPAGRELVVLVDGCAVGSVHTLAPPPGGPLGRIATISDRPIGERAIGRLPRIRSSHDDEQAQPLRCLRAAIAEAGAWGADRLVVKGDLTGESSPGSAAPVLSTDVPGVRLILADSATAGRDLGTTDGWADEVLQLAAEAPGPVLLVCHPYMHLPVRTHQPAGIPRREAAPFLAKLGQVNPASLVTSGHTRRIRRRSWGPVVTTEVGSTMDHPGTWAGYLVYEGGIVQTVRRIMDPDVTEWTERTRRTALGIRGLWSLGRLADRSFSHTWTMDIRRSVRVSHVASNASPRRAVATRDRIGTPVPTR